MPAPAPRPMERETPLGTGPGEPPRSLARWFWLLAGGPLLLGLAIGLLTQPNATGDTVEMVLWGREWQWGYYKHPPLPAWIAAAAFELAGGSVWGVCVAGQLAVLACIWAAWRLGRELLPPPLALLGAALLLACHHTSYAAVEVNNTSVSRAFQALAVLSLFRALERNRLRFWLAGGLAMGLALLSKLDSALLAVSLLAFAVLHPAARRRWAGTGPWAALCVALAIFAPHAVWMRDNEFATLSYAFARTVGQAMPLARLTHPALFLGNLAAASLPMLFVLFPLTGWRWQLRALPPEDAFRRGFLAAAVLLPPALALLLSVLTGAELKARWGAAFFTFAGPLLLFALRLRDSPSNRRSAARRWVLVVGLLLAAAVAHNVAGPWVRGRASGIHFPGAELSREVAALWREHQGGKLPIVAGPSFPAGNVALYSPSCVRVVVDFGTRPGPWADAADLRREGGVVLWNAGNPPPGLTAFLASLPAGRALDPLTLPWQTRARIPPLRLGIVLVPPTPATETTRPHPETPRPGAQP